MSRKGPSASRCIGAQGDPGGWDSYSLAGSGNSVDANVTVNSPGPGYLQLWYREDTIPPNVILTTSQTGMAGETAAAGPRGAGARAWAVALDSFGEVQAVGAEVNVED